MSNIDNIRTLIDALRSGEFQQSQNYLLDSKNGDKRCCLGVAAFKMGIPDEKCEQNQAYCSNDESNKYSIPHETEKMRANRLVLDEIRDWLGVTTEQIHEAADWNDCLRYDFETIANQMEQKWLNKV